MPAGLRLLPMRPSRRFHSFLAVSVPAFLLSVHLAAAIAEPVLESNQGGYAGTGTLGPDGCLYSPSADGANGGIRKFTPDGGSILLVSFTGNGGASRGASPSQLTLGRDGSFYGTTAGGGTSGNGTVFRLAPNGQLTTLADFPSDGADPARNPQGGVILARDGNLYGTTSTGGPSRGGTIFSVSPAGALTTRFSFYNFMGSSTGGTPLAPLVEGADGQLYGSTSKDGGYVTGGNPGVNGVAFRFDPASGTYVVIYNFNTFHYVSGANIFLPYVLAKDGLFYGVSRYGGNSQHGLVFTLGQNGPAGYVCDFAGGVYGPPTTATAGEFPEVALTETPDGNLYGTTLGGRFYAGTVYRITPAVPFYQAYTLITQEAGIGRLSLGADGNLHGGSYRLRFGPTPATGNADATETGATLSGTVNPNGAATLARFESGTSPDALTALTPAQDLGAGTTPADLSANLTGLAPGTTYYFRARGDNANQFQPQRGFVRAFTTAGTSPALVSVTPDPGGLRVRGRGLAGVPNAVQWSDNLVSWQALPGAVAPAARGVGEVVDAAPKPPARRFYRFASAP